MDSSSSDSDIPEVVRNIQTVIIKSDSADQENNKKYAYKRRLGDLIFDANFETGNLGLVEQINEYDYDLMVRPDVANPRVRLWFNFTVSNQLPNQCVIFTFVNLSESINLFHEGLTPVVRSKQEPNWVRLHGDQVFYHRSASHGNRYVLSLAFRFSTYDNMHQFALFYPYGHTTLKYFIQRWQVNLKRIEQKRNHKSSEGALKRSESETRDLRVRLGDFDLRDLQELRTRSSQGFYRNASQKSCQEKIGDNVEFLIEQLSTSILSKPVYHISLRGTVGLKEDNLLPKVIIIARTCGNLDSVTSYICQGSMDYLLSDNLIARTARHCINFVFLPMIDPDSISAGNSRTDIMGQSNLTPKTMEKNPSIYENYIRARKLLLQTCQDSDMRVVIIELRSNIDLIGSRIVGTYYGDSSRMERHLSLPRLFTRFTNDFYLENCIFNNASQARRSLFDPDIDGQLCNTDFYRLETSPYAYYKRSLFERSYKEYDQRKYLSLGKALIFALLELLRPKDRALPYGVTAILDAFHPKSDDIDDLLLKQD